MFFSKFPLKKNVPRKQFLSDCKIYTVFVMAYSNSSFPLLNKINKNNENPNDCDDFNTRLWKNKHREACDA
eukprot:Pgem_evm1s4644